MKKEFIEDVRKVLRVLLLFLPVPMFWALFYQEGSRWTLQATQMDFSFVSHQSISPLIFWLTALCAFGDAQVKPDHMRMLNPLLVLFLIPIFDSIIYPLLAKCNLLTK